MRPDEARVADTRAWLVRAHEDLRGAAVDLAATPPLLGDATFHCQQAVEKAMKAFLAWHDHPFRKTHDLAELGRQCVTLDPTLEPPLRQAAPLSEYAWRYRYPGDPDEPTRDEVDEALAIARQVVATLTGRLPAAVRP